MKVYLSADIEGTCGIIDWSETERSTPNVYDIYRHQMEREVAAACRAAVIAAKAQASPYRAASSSSVM